MKKAHNNRRARSLTEIARHCGGRIQGDGDIRVETVATLHNADPNAISFLANSRYRKFLADTRAAAVILAANDAEHCPVAALIAPDPYVAYAKAAQLLAPAAAVQPGVHPAAVVVDGAVVDPTAEIAAGAVIETGVRIGAGVFVGPNCVVKAGAELDENARLVANVTICEDVRIGARTIAHPGVVVGADGFGIADENGKWLKVPQVGSVVIGADVEIGANTAIDRGAIEDTIIEDGVKVDNLVQIGHNVRIGAHSAIAGCCGISGSAVIGRHCILGGRVGVVGHIEIADNAIVTGATVVSHSITEAGVYSGSMPMDTAQRWRKNSVRIRQLDELARRVHSLEKKVKD